MNLCERLFFLLNAILNIKITRNWIFFLNRNNVFNALRTGHLSFAEHSVFVSTKPNPNKIQMKSIEQF